MATTSAVSMAIPLVKATTNRRPISADSFLKPLPLTLSLKPISVLNSTTRFQVNASLKEKAVTGLTATALTVSMMIPEVAEAAESSLSPTINNFLLSIGAGGVVLGVIVGAVIAVSNFDPVKRS